VFPEELLAALVSSLSKVWRSPGSDEYVDAGFSVGDDLRAERSAAWSPVHHDQTQSAESPFQQAHIGPRGPEAVPADSCSVAT